MKQLRYLLFGLIVSGSFASSASPEFDKGLAAANKKEYAVALKHFEAVLKQEPGNASAYYNIGHCYFEQKQYGDAIWAFEKSLQSDPRNSNTLKNLEVCHFQLELPPYTPLHSGFARSLYAFGSTNWSYVAIISIVLLSLFLILTRLSRNLSFKRMYILGALFFALVGLLAIVAASKSSTAEGNQNCAVVTARTIPTFLNESGEKSPINLVEGMRISELSAHSNLLLEGVLENGQVVLIDGKGIKRF